MINKRKFPVSVGHLAAAMIHDVVEVNPQAEAMGGAHHAQ
jgi:hypothetical protein